MACPFMAAAAADPTKAAMPDVSQCPMHSEILAAHQTAGHLPAHAQSAAVCPLGFGSSKGPKLSSLHCPVCKGLLFEAHTTSSCKHTFCHACISKTADCPVCGMDVDGTEPNAEITGLVDTFLDTHSKSPQLVAAQADLGPLPDNSAASFFMAQGLKSLAGGNVHAALHRLGRCREALLAETTATAASDSSTAAAAVTAGHDGPVAVDADRSAAVLKTCQLAAACGCLADCYQRLGDASQAEQLYNESIRSVEPYSEQDAEAAHAMSVSLNKLGDLRYGQQQLQAAKQLYKQALQLRQLACGPLTHGQAGPGQQLELATSLIKLADICKALGESGEAEQLLHTAAGVCFEVKVQAAGLPASTAQKLQMLLDVLHAEGMRGEGAAAAGAAEAAT